MTARLLCKFGEMAGAEFDIDDEATIGRSQSCAIVLTSDSVSGQHARIFWDDAASHYVVEDLDSLNGTKVDGIAVSGRQPLSKLHVLNFGRRLDFIFVARGGPTGSSADVAPAKPAGVTTLIDPEPPTLPADLLEEETTAASVSSTLVGFEPVALPDALTGDGETQPRKDPEESDADDG